MRKYGDTGRFMADMAASACLIQGFAAYLAVLILLGAPGESQWRDADPILTILPREVTLWGVPVLSVAVLLAWIAIRRPAPREFAGSLRHVLAGAAVAIVLSLALRMIFGPNLPDFIPPEESARPGYLLGMSAGLAEELIFRLLLTPILFAALRRRLGFGWSAALTIAIVALSFALLHEAGAGAQDFAARYFLARVMVPGVVMGLACFVISPQFLVTAHCSAHVMIPLLFA